jgi:hypothetical protein
MNSITPIANDNVTFSILTERMPSLSSRMKIKNDDEEFESTRWEGKSG